MMISKPKTIHAGQYLLDFTMCLRKTSLALYLFALVPYIDIKPLEQIVNSNLGKGRLKVYIIAYLKLMAERQPTKTGMYLYCPCNSVARGLPSLLKLLNATHILFVGIR